MSGALRDAFLGRARWSPIPSFSPHLSPFPTADSYFELLLHSLPSAVSAPYGQPYSSISPSPSLLCASNLSCIGTLYLCLTFLCDCDAVCSNPSSGVPPLGVVRRPGAFFLHLHLHLLRKVGNPNTSTFVNLP